MTEHNRKYVRKFEKVKIERIKPYDEITIYYNENNDAFHNCLVVEVSRSEYQGNLLHYNLSVLSSSGIIQHLEIKPDMIDNVRIYRYNLDGEINESKLVKIFYKSPYCDKVSNHHDIKITRGKVENIANNSVWIRNENNVLEKFRFDDIVQMIEVKEWPIWKS